MLDLKTATPQIVVNYASFLEENRYFEEAFSVYERGVALFRWPIVFEIWNVYLIKFINRYVRFTHITVKALTLTGQEQAGAHPRAVRTGCGWLPCQVRQVCLSALRDL